MAGVPVGHGRCTSGTWPVYQWCTAGVPVGHGRCPSGHGWCPTVNGQVARDTRMAASGRRVCSSRATAAANVLAISSTCKNRGVGRGSIGRAGSNLHFSHFFSDSFASSAFSPRAFGGENVPKADEGYRAIGWHEFSGRREVTARAHSAALWRSQMPPRLEHASVNLKNRAPQRHKGHRDRPCSLRLCGLLASPNARAATYRHSVYNHAPCRSGSERKGCGRSTLPRSSEATSWPSTD